MYTNQFSTQQKPTHITYINTYTYRLTHTQVLFAPENREKYLLL